jgi:hypothetical protein
MRQGQVQWKRKTIFNMKYSVHETEAKAEAENQRLMTELGIPDGKGTTSYGTPELRDGEWILRVKEEGAWKADDIAKNVKFIEETDAAL